MERKPATKGGDQMIKHNQTLRVCYTALALALCTLSIGCSDDDEDNLAATMASLIASGNCVDQEPATLSEDNQEVTVGNFTLSVGDPTNPVTFVPSLCKVPNGQIKNNGKTSPVSQILYLKNVNLGSLTDLSMNLSLATNIQGITGFLKYVPEQQALGADSSQRSDDEGNIIAAANLQGNTAFIGIDVSVARSEDVGNLAFDGSSFASGIITQGCSNIIEAASSTFAAGVRLGVNLNFFGVGSNGLGPDGQSLPSTCDLLEKANLSKACKKGSKFGKKLCNAVFSKFTQQLVCMSLDQAIGAARNFSPVQTESCGKGALLSDCLRNDAKPLCTILGFLIGQNF
ncbi:MAG: hypothetical protein AAF320_06090 [Myxococcota bacterium]